MSDVLPIKRAQALGARTIRGAANRIHGLNASAIGFEPMDDTPAHDAPLIEGLDHLSQTLAYDEMLSWSLFYTTIFGLSKSPIADVVDPDGLVKSQVLSNDGATTRIILNGSDGPQTMAGAFAGEGQGSAAHHIAFATPDIMALAARLQDRGIPTLGHSQNYYDDLGARFGLSPETLDRLRTHNLMYDEDEAGAFYQLYLPGFDNGFFFEFVQSAGGYGGLGAPNAPYRLAAQRRLARTGAGEAGH